MEAGGSLYCVRASEGSLASSTLIVCLLLLTITFAILHCHVSELDHALCFMNRTRCRTSVRLLLCVGAEVVPVLCFVHAQHLTASKKHHSGL